MSNYLSSYLTDHHAGSTGGLEVARRTAKSNRDTRYGDELESIAKEIDTDRDALERVMESVGASPSRVKDGGAWLAEKVGRLKMNGTVLSYSPASRVLEIEGLIMAVTGKESIWRALSLSRVTPPDGIDFDELARRAVDQRDRLAALHQMAAEEAFG